MSDDLMIVHDSADELETTAIAVRGTSAGVQHTTDVLSPMELIRFAIESKTPASELKELVALATQIEDRNAAKEFNRSLKEFQRECPPIKKNRTAKITTKGGGGFSYSYAEMDVIEPHIKPYLDKYGFSYSFDTEVDDKGVMCTSICTLLHENGHSRQSRFKLPIASESAASPQQKVGIADTYAMRRALGKVLGLNITDKEAPDDEVTETEKTITEQQAIALLTLIDEKKRGRNDEKVFLERFLAKYGIEALDHLPVSEYDGALATLSSIKTKETAS